MKPLSLAQRLIVAADFKPVAPPQGTPTWTGRRQVRDKVSNLARALMGSGVIIKVNSALRAVGYDLIDELHSFSVEVFADLKLVDIKNTIDTDGALLAEAKPDLLTAFIGGTAMPTLSALQQVLPKTEVLGVTVLTDFDDKDTTRIFGAPVLHMVELFAGIARKASLGGVICSAKEASLLREKFGQTLSLNTPAIRPRWSVVAGDDQKRVMTPADAIKAGADRIVVGRPIVESNDPRGAVNRTLEEINAALDSPG